MDQHRLNHKGYIGAAAWDYEARVYFGHVIGMRHLITYEAETPSELEEAFRSSVDCYLELCEESGESPEKPQPCNVKDILARLPESRRKAIIDAADVMHAEETKKPNDQASE
jgi:predicted HicB family RNase H-like nuclease